MVREDLPEELDQRPECSEGICCVEYQRERESQAEGPAGAKGPEVGVLLPRGRDQCG